MPWAAYRGLAYREPGSKARNSNARSAYDLVRPDVVGQHRDAAFDRLERDPAAARLEKRDAQARVTIDDTARDYAQGDQHHLHRVRDHVARRAVGLGLYATRLLVHASKDRAHRSRSRYAERRS